jgi:hypothetical protein
MPLPSLLSVVVATAVTTTPAPRDTVVYTVSNHGRQAGRMTVVHEEDGLEVRYAHVDRNRGRWVFGRYEVDDDGRVLRVEAGPTSREGEPGAVEETVERLDGSEEAGFLGAFSTPLEQARAARFLLRQPGGSWVDADGDTLRARVVGEAESPVGRLRLAMLDLGRPWEVGVWLDPAGELYASEAAWFITHRPGAEALLPTLRAVEAAHRDREGEALAAALAVPAAGSLVIRNGDVFDSESGEIRPRMTVVVEGDRIAAVGPVGDVEEPAGAEVLDATGMTVMPGMWDMHSHSVLPSQTAGAPLQLAHGLTTVRDLAADLDVALALRDRADDGSIVSPRQVLAGFMEGPGAWAGPSEVIVRTEAEARRWVTAYDSMGYRQIKLYNLIHPDLLPTIAEEARGRGLRLSGHIPRGMSVRAAVELGYDEVNHAAFLFSTFYPDSLWVPTMRPYSGVAAAVAASVDVDGPEMTGLLDFLAQEGTVVDGTFNIWMGGQRFLDPDQASSPSAAAYGRLLLRLWERGVPLVPGTDSFDGSSYLTELLLYEHVGIPAAQVLRLATLVPAQVMGESDDYGRVAPGMVADLLLVDGSPAERIADLERIHRVVRAGRVYDPAAIRAAVEAGPSGR